MTTKDVDMIQPTFRKQYEDLSVKELIQHALGDNEGVMSNTKALVVNTGKRTGRSPKDRFIIKDEYTSKTVDWGKINQPISEKIFNHLWEKTIKYLSDKTVYISHLRVGADPKLFLPIKVITEKAWHHIFAKYLFINPQEDYAKHRKPWIILNAPGLKPNPTTDGTHSDGAVMLNFSKRQVLLCGMEYAGEMKKAMFSVLNFLLPEEDVLPMHCSANVGEKGDVALFFGLSGTGKTTLSADPKRYLIGDDEHGWSQHGVFNFEGGCYAKCINLSHKNEPIIWEAIRDGAIMENVVIDEQGQPDYKDSSLTENTRAAYPREYIKKRVIENKSDVPRSVVFLTCDLYGVIPPISLLTKEQAAYHFLSGYTALVGSTEVGTSKDISSTFSACFGAPFFPRPASVYADLLIKRIEESKAQVYLINTGWTGGKYGKGGKRFSIPVTRSIVNAALSGELLKSEKEILPGFNFHIPKHLEGVDNSLLNPKNTWKNPDDFDRCLNELIDKFIENAKKFNISSHIKNAGPKKIA